MSPLSLWEGWGEGVNDIETALDPPHPNPPNGRGVTGRCEIILLGALRNL
jgi:hypothetical protein